QERDQVERERKKRREQVRKLVAGVCIAAGLAILFGITGVWALHQKRVADEKTHLATVSSVQAKSSANAARKSEKAAKQNARISYKTVDELMTQVAAVDLADMPQMTTVRTHLLDEARKSYEKLREENEDPQEPEMLWVAARARSRLGDILAML